MNFSNVLPYSREAKIVYLITTRLMFMLSSVCVKSFLVILQETTRSQHSSGGKEKMLANSPCTKVETPKVSFITLSLSGFSEES